MLKYLIYLIYLVLALSLILLFIVLLYKRKQGKIRIVFWGFVITYLIFIGLAVVNYKLSQADLAKEKKEIDNLSSQSEKPAAKQETKTDDQKNTTAPTVPATEQAAPKAQAPLTIAAHEMFGGRVGQKLLIRLTITNNSNEDLNNFKMIFDDSAFLKPLVINALNPKAVISNNVFSYGKFPANSSKDYTIEAYPNKTGTYETTVSFRNGDDNLTNSDGNAVKDNVQMTINP